MSSSRSNSPDTAMPRFLDAASEETRARLLADRLGLPYVDLWTFRIDAETFLELRYDREFVTQLHVLR